LFQKCSFMLRIPVLLVNSMTQLTCAELVRMLLVTSVLQNFFHHIQKRFWNLRIFLLEGMVQRLNHLFELSVAAAREVCHTVWDERRLLRTLR
jgi:hypothetical protein